MSSPEKDAVSASSAAPLSDSSRKRRVKRRREKRKVTLSGKLVGAIALVLFFVMFTIIFATYKGLDWLYLIEEGLKTWQAADHAAVTYNTKPEKFKEELSLIEGKYEIGLEIFDSSGRLLYTNLYKGNMADPPYDGFSAALPDELKRNFVVIDNGGTTRNSDHYEIHQKTASDGTKSEYLVFVKSLNDDIGMRIYKLKSPVDESARLAVSFVSVVTMIVLFVAMLTIYILIRSTTKPLINMSNVTGRMAELDFSEKCKDSNVVEISKLANSINVMSDSLENSLEDLRLKNKRLQMDIEQEKTIDQLRSLFISGISHELKTPIAIISGYAEGIQVFLDSGDYATAKKYSSIIIDESDRMNKLVLRLLEMIKYESGDYKPMNENFRLTEIFDEWFSRNSEILAGRCVTAKNFIDRSIIADTDSFMVSTVANNYLSNALSHVSGDMRIETRAQEISEDTVRVMVFNSGSHIEDRDIDKIWDSFYRADKSLSRSQGRFGLGLAIVASIQKTLGMEYGVRNTEDGVEFMFDIRRSKKTVADGENYAPDDDGEKSKDKPL